MRILLAPDKFRGSFTSREACRALARGIASVDPSIQVEARPMADGGEGTLEVLLELLGGGTFPIRSFGPMGEPLTGEAGKSSAGEIVVESARFCGLQLVAPGRRDPLQASTFGVGAALRAVLASRPPRILVGLGGSATVDGGLGAGRALGFTLRDRGGALLKGLGGEMERLHAIEPPPGGPPAAEVILLADTTAPLTGPRGAVPLFAAQKGAGAPARARLERGLEIVAGVIARDLGVQVGEMAGGGAAGGLAAGLAAFLGGRITPGAETVAGLAGLEECLDRADAVVTGEGAFHGGHSGKVCDWICRAAARREVPVAIVTGSVEGPAPPGVVRFIGSGRILGEGALEEAGKWVAGRGFWGE